MAHFDPMDLVAANLRRIRTECELTQEQLAHRSGVDRTFVSLCERNHRNVTVASIFALARGLGCDPGDLFRPCPPIEFDPWWTPSKAKTRKHRKATK